MWSPKLFLIAIHSARTSSRKFMVAPVGSASWQGAEHSSGRGGSVARLINALFDASRALPPEAKPSGCVRQNRRANPPHRPPFREGELLTRRLSVPGLASVHVRTSVGSENSVPEEVDHREVAVRVQMVDEVKLLFAPEPSEAREVRTFDVVILVQIYVRVE